MSWLFPRGTRRMPPVWVDDVPKSVKAEIANDFVKESLNKPLDYTGGFKMDDKELIEKRANDIMERDPLAYHPIWEDEMLKEQIKNTTDEDIEKFCESLGITRKPEPFEVIINNHVEKSVERKKRLMQMYKVELIDMIFDLESRNETLVNNLLEIEKICAKKSGHWIELPKALDSSERPVRCSVCNTVMSFYHGFKAKYCSECGAKMYKEEEDDT